MRIFFYCLPLNERFYAQYAYNALIKLGHIIYSKSIYTQNLNTVKRIQNDQTILEQDLDLILFHGFSFTNHLSHQKLPPEKLLINQGIPYSVFWYDNPLRYRKILEKNNVLNTPYTFFCCDSELSTKMRQLGYTRTYHSPCVFDPEFQNLDIKVNPNFVNPLAFAGTVLNDDLIKKIQMKCGQTGFEILKRIESRRTPGQYQDYVSELESEGIDHNHPHYIDLCHAAIMQQKHFLRMEIFAATRPLELQIYGQGDWQPQENSNIFRNKNLDQVLELPQLYRSAKIQLSVELLPASTHQRLIETAACGGAFVAENKVDIKNDFESALIWTSLPHLKEICTHLLNDSHKRQEYAKQLYEEVQSKHRNDIRMKKNLEVMDVR